jgi:hypothetical protein
MMKQTIINAMIKDKLKRAALLSLLIFVAAKGFSNIIDETFFGITFGCSSADVKSILESKGCKCYDNGHGIIYIENVIFDDYKYDLVSFGFSNDKFNEIKFMADVVPDISATERSETIKYNLEAAYGKPKIIKDNTIGFIDNENICTYGHFLNEKDICYNDLLKFKHFDVVNSPKDGVTLRLTYIYSDVIYRLLSVQNPADSIGIEYMSSEYRNIYQQMNQVQQSHPQNKRALDYNHWIIMKDWSSIGYKIESISIASASNATAQIKIRNKNISRVATLSLVLESGKWFVDDFTINGISEKETLKDYIKNNS